MSQNDFPDSPPRQKMKNKVHPISCHTAGQLNQEDDFSPVKLQNRRMGGLTFEGGVI